MPGSRRRLAIWTVAFIAAACAPEPQRVYVNLETALTRDRQAASPAAPSLGALQPFPALRGELGALPSKNLDLPVARRRIDAAKAMVKASEQAAYDSLAHQLRDIRVSEIVRTYNARLDALRPALATARADALRKAQEALNRTAPQRGYALARLALMVGFPDPDPLSTRDFEPTSRRAQRRLEEARTWREIMRTIDADNGDAADRFDAEALDAYYKSLAEVYDEMDQAKRSAEIEAQKEAEAQRSKAGTGVASILGNGAEAHLGAVRGTRVQTSPGPRPKTRLDLSFGGAAGAGLPRRQLESDLQIWLAAKGYVLAKAGGSARDATEEFLLWRREQRAGR